VLVPAAGSASDHLPPVFSLVVLAGQLAPLLVIRSRPRLGQGELVQLVEVAVAAAPEILVSPPRMRRVPSLGLELSCFCTATSLVMLAKYMMDD
jgi:hypothetical protein